MLKTRGSIAGSSSGPPAVDLSTGHAGHRDKSRRSLGRRRGILAPRTLRAPRSNSLDRNFSSVSLGVLCDLRASNPKTWKRRERGDRRVELFQSSTSSPSVSVTSVANLFLAYQNNPSAQQRSRCAPGRETFPFLYALWERICARLLTPGDAEAFEFYKEGFSRRLPARLTAGPRFVVITPQLQSFLKPTPWLVKGGCLVGGSYDEHEQPTQQDDTGLP